MRGLADLVRLSSRPTQAALQPTPLAEAVCQRHRARSTAAALNCRDHSFPIPWRAARARFARVDPADRPRSTRAGGLGVVVFAVNAGALHPTPLDEAPLYHHRARTAAVISNDVATAIERRAARPAYDLPRSEPAGRPRSMCALADLAWLSSRPTRGALQPTPSVEALLYRHHARSASAVSN